MICRSLWMMLLIFTLYGCGDGRKIAGNYYLQDSNSAHIYIQRKSGEDLLVVVDAQVVGYFVSRPYIVVHRVVADSYECLDASGQRTIITHYTGRDEYWVLNYETEEKDGPYNIKEIGFWAEDAGVGDIKISQFAWPASNTNSFKKGVSECDDLEKISF